jgi:hypothetical protein
VSFSPPWPWLTSGLTSSWPPSSWRSSWRPSSSPAFFDPPFLYPGWLSGAGAPSAHARRNDQTLKGGGGNERHRPRPPGFPEALTSSSWQPSSSPSSWQPSSSPASRRSPLSVHGWTLRTPRQHLGSQEASHTSCRVGRPLPSVKRNLSYGAVHALRAERVRLWMDVWKSPQSAPGASSSASIARTSCAAAPSAGDALRTVGGGASFTSGIPIGILIAPSVAREAGRRRGEATDRPLRLRPELEPPVGRLPYFLV